MGVAIVGWGRRVIGGLARTVPSPADGSAQKWWWDVLAEKMPELGAAGFTAILLPPVSKAQGGAGAGVDGYGLFDPRDLGNKPQQGSIRTRYGSSEQLRRLVASAHASGMEVYLDVVLHQLSGENEGNGEFRYLGADGHTLNGRGPMHPGCFRGVPPANRPPDPVPDPAHDFPFGREKVYENCIPAGYTINDALDFGDWLFRTTGADGLRCDDVKGLSPVFVSQFMRSRAMASKFAVSEFFDGSIPFINSWVTPPPMSSRSLVFDFPLKFALGNACNNQTAAGLDGAGYAAHNPFLACTFVENPDTDVSPGQTVVSSKLLAYAFILSAEGYPFVFGKDYFPPSVLRDAYGLKPFIDNLVWIHEHLAGGPSVTRFADAKVFVLNRTGNPGLLTALNFDTFNARTITCDTAFGPNVTLQDYTGRHHDIVTDGQGRATFTIPSNAFAGGQSYLCFSRAGFKTPFNPVPRRTNQTFFGANDLDIPAASDTARDAGRVWCAANSRIQTTLRAQEDARHVGAGVTLELLAPDRSVLGSAHAQPGQSAHVNAVAAHGFQTLRITGVNTPPEGIPFEVEVDYEGSSRFP
jgi:alpha-amylase